MKRRSKQLALDLRARTWGGARKGAGRPRSNKQRIAHRGRPIFSHREPLHVTLRMVAGLNGLRSKVRLKLIRDSLGAARERLGARVVQYSVQSNHLHLIVEAVHRVALGRAMRGIQIRIARALNGHLGRKGPVFDDRYHLHVLRTPREVRHALAYVLLNARRHAWQRGERLPARWLDPCSSAPSFDGWRTTLRPPAVAEPPITADAASWLLSQGWRRHGLIDPDEIPGDDPRTARAGTAPR